MKTTIHSESDVKEYEGKLPSVPMVYFKMVGIGPNTIQKSEQRGDRVCDVANKQVGFFLMSRSADADLRAAMHDLVDRFCDAQEEG